MDDIVDRIEAVRQSNNKAWMDLLRLALDSEPVKAKAILKEIKANDGEIHRLLAELSD